MNNSISEQLDEIYLEESVGAGIKRLLSKYPPIDITVKGNAVPNDWDWDNEKDSIYDEV